MTQNGLQVNRTQGIYFGNAASHTTDANGKHVNRNTLDVAGSGQLAGFNFHVDGNCGGTCMNAGEWSAPGMTSAQARSALNANSFTIPFEDARAGFGGGEHGYSNQFRFGGSFFGCAISACPNTHTYLCPTILRVPIPSIAFPQQGCGMLMRTLVGSLMGKTSRTLTEARDVNGRAQSFPLYKLTV